jgi:hypothetical protein
MRECDNPENDWSKHGHRHSPKLSIVPEPIERVDFPRVVSYSVLGGVCMGILSERAINMFDEVSRYSIGGGIGVGIISSLSIAIYSSIKFKKF